MLAELGHSNLDGLIVCLVVVAIVAAAVYVVCGPILKQSWAALAAAVVFLLGALLCLV